MSLIVNTNEFFMQSIADRELTADLMFVKYTSDR